MGAGCWHVVQPCNIVALHCRSVRPLTPPLSARSCPMLCHRLLAVVSAVAGLQVGVPQVTPTMIMGVSIAILVLLFGVQFKGTAAVSAAFSPIMLLWLASNCAIGETTTTTQGSWSASIYLTSNGVLIWEGRAVYLPWTGLRLHDRQIGTRVYPNLVGLSLNGCCACELQHAAPTNLCCLAPTVHPLHRRSQCANLWPEHI
jgi:hypothetical protein